MTHMTHFLTWISCSEKYISEIKREGKDEREVKLYILVPYISIWKNASYASSPPSERSSPCTTSRDAYDAFSETVLAVVHNASPQREK